MSLRRLLSCLLVVAFVVLVPASPAPAASLPPRFSETTIGGLNAPTAMAFAPDGRLFVTEQGGALRIIQNGVLLPTPFATVPVDSNGERGLLGVAFPPDFATSHRVYVYFTNPTPTAHNVVAWFGGADTNSATSGPNIVVTLPNLGATNHNGGAIHFSPTDGQLYIAVGENAVQANAQDLTTPLGKMLRVDANGSPSSGNPSFGGAAHDGRVWAYGLRNPFTFAFQPGTGTLFIDDVGSSGGGACGNGTWEEINPGGIGSNYGWPIVEGPAATPACTRAGVTYPLYAYPHSDPTQPCAIAGGTFYNPTNPLLDQSFVGGYFFSDLCGGWIRFRAPDGTVSEPFTAINQPVDLSTGPDGALWYLAHSGVVGRIVAAQPAWQLFLRNSPSSGPPDNFFFFGIVTDDVLFCDWDGNGTDTIGIHRGNTWQLHNANDGGPTEVVFTFGNPGDVPICGNWDGSGGDTVGVRRGNTFFLRNSNSSGVANVTALFGDPGDTPVVGDWTHTGHASIGVHRGHTFFLRNQNTTGAADTTIVFGDPGDQPIVGDWDGNGTDTIGVHRANTFFLRNANTAGGADIVSLFGNATDRGVSGAWTGGAADGIGVARDRPS